MAERRASKRERRKPELFGTFGAAEDAEELEPQQQSSDEEEEEEEQRPRKRARNQRRRAADSEADEEEEAPAAGRVGGSGRTTAKCAPRQPRKQQAREAAELPPPAQPLSRADFLGALHACPTLIDMILQQDGLRTPTLLARDAANLAAALCASTQQMDGAWRVIAARGAGGEGFAGTTAEALEAAKAAVKGDPARSQRCTTTTAKQDYRLSDKDLADLDYVTRHNPIFWSAAPTRLYRVLDCIAIAHRKYGDLAGIRAAKAKAQERGQKVKATRQGNTERRKQEMEAAMQAEGLNSWRYRKHGEVTGFIKHGRSTAAEVAAGLKKTEEKEARVAERRQKLVKRLDEEGLSGSTTMQWLVLPAAQRFLAGEGKETVASVVAAAKKEKAKKEGQAQRQAALHERLELEGLWEGVPEWYTTAEYIKYNFPGASSYIASGEGSIDSIVETVRAAQEKQAAREEAARQRKLAVNERRDRALAALEAAGIDWTGRSIYDVPELFSFVHEEMGNEEDLVPAVQARLQEREEQKERRSHVETLLRDAGLSEVHGVNYIGVVHHYIMTGEGDDAALLAAARAEHERHAKLDQRAQELAEQRQLQQQARSERSARVAQLLRDNGLPSFYTFSVASIAYYIETGEGSDAADMTDAKRHHNSKPYTQRLAELMAGAAGGAAGGDGAGQGGAAAEDGDAAAAAAGAGAAAAAAAAGPMLW